MNIGCIYSVDDFVSTDKVLPTFASMPFGLSYIATSLKHAGHNVSILVATPKTNFADMLAKFINEYKPMLFCLTSVTSQYHLISDIAKAIKAIDPSIYVLLGGHHATLNPEETIKETYFDAICIGEGERAVVKFASCIERNEQPTEISNLWIKHKKEAFVEKNPLAPFIQVLDDLPHIDRKMWDKWVAEKDRMPAVLLGRGCPNKCTYCSNHALAKITKGRYVRFRTPGDVISELNEIVERYPLVKTIYLEVETFGVNLRYAYEMCDHLEKFNSIRKKRINFGVNLAVNQNLIGNTELLKSLKKANIKFLNIGLESGSEKVRNEILRRPKYSNKDFVGFCRLVKEYGIDIHLYVLFGIPGETLSDFKETIACVRQCGPKHVNLSIFYPYPGTDLYSRAKKMQLFTEDIIDPSMERRKVVLELPGFSRKQIRREYLLFPYNVYKGKKSICKILSCMARSYIGMYPKFNSLYRRSVNHNCLRSLRHKLSTFSK